MADRLEIGRVAFRVEGRMWNCYWAPKQDTMNDAILIGSIIMSVVVGDPQVKKLFMETMKAAVTYHFKNTFGHKPAWDAPRPAPEHEKAGHG